MTKHHILALLALLAPGATHASTVTQTDPQAGGVGYKYTVTLGGYDSATFSSHVGAWSWEDNALFDAEAGEPPVGWTHTSNWVAIEVTARVIFTVRLERDATVPWPSQADPDRLASTASMFPSFTIWRNWDNDDDDTHTYNNRGAVEWAEDLVYETHTDNSTLETIERTFILPPGKYSVAIGSNAPATDTNRQGYKATFTTSPELRSDSYFAGSAVQPVVVAAAQGVLVNDDGVAAPADVVEMVGAPAKGQVALAADGSFTYTPGAYFGVVGRDSFTYRVLVGGDVNKPTSAKAVTISTLPAAAGSYAGHLKSEGTGADTGLVKLDLTPKGTWTAALLHAGKRLALRGKLSADGVLLPGRAVAGLSLRLSTHDNGTRFADLQIGGSAEAFSAEADQSPFNALTPPPFTGAHAVTLAVKTSSEGAPQGAGRATLRVAKNGSATLVGRLGDRTPFSSGSALLAGSGSGPTVPIFDVIYRAKAGSVSGQLEFGPVATSAAEGSLRVVKPAQAVPAVEGFTISYDAATVLP